MNEFYFVDSTIEEKMKQEKPSTQISNNVSLPNSYGEIEQEIDNHNLEKLEQKLRAEKDNKPNGASFLLSILKSKKELKPIADDSNEEFRETTK